MMVLAAMLAVAATGEFNAWARFSRAPLLGRPSDQVEVATRGAEPGSHDLHLVMRLTRRTLRVVQVSWADSTTCPAVRTTVRAMSSLVVPRVTSPYDGRNTRLIIDGTAYGFEGPASGPNGRIAFSSNAGTPLAAWVDARLAALAPCWKPVES